MALSGEMLASTILAIPFVPVFYVITQRWSERRSTPGTKSADSKLETSSATGE